LRDLRLGLAAIGSIVIGMIGTAGRADIVERWGYGQPGAGGRVFECPSPRPDSPHAKDDTKK